MNTPLGILAQRLAKKLCDCKQAYTPDAQEITDFIAEYAEALRHTDAWKIDVAGEAEKLLHDWQARYGQGGRLRLYRPVGCEHCGHTGYKGRIGLHELMVAEVFSCAVSGGMRTLKMDGMEKVLMGLTDLKMVRAVSMK